MPHRYHVPYKLQSNAVNETVVKKAWGQRCTRRLTWYGLIGNRMRIRFPPVMRYWPRWTPERDEELKRHKAAGLTSREIAVLLHSTPHGIHGRSRKLGLISPLWKSGFWTPERDENLKRHEAAGLSATKIAVLLGTTRGAILGRSNRLRGKVFKSDLERRPRRRSPASAQTSETPINSPDVQPDLFGDNFAYASCR
jgi:hypothetical protein